MRLLVVTLAERQIGPAIVSWLAAVRRARADLPRARIDHLWLHGNPINVADGHDIVTLKYREAQEVFLRGDWWAMVTVEDDMIIPEDALLRLAQLVGDGADIGYGLYVWRHGSPRWSAYMSVGARQGTSIDQDPEVARAAWGTVIDVAGVGMGCTIFSRRALETIRFRRDGPACCDWYAALDAQRAGLVQRCDLGLVCGHVSLDPYPRAFYPDVEGNANGLYRVEGL